jgi:hypothetical protein
MAKRKRAIEPLDAEFYFEACDLSAAVACVRSRGVAVLCGAMPIEEVDAARRAVKTWHAADGPSLKINKKGFVLGRDAGQCEGVWRVRASRVVQEAFAKVWSVGISELLTSLDALIIWLARTSLSDLEPHRDRPSHSAIPQQHSGDDRSQRITRRTQTTALVQGQVPLLPVTQQTGGFYCCPGEGFANHSLDPKLVQAQAGDLILWDARCRHGAALGPDVQEANGFVRLAVLVCMAPRAHASDSALEHLEDLFHRGGCKFHEPHLYDDGQLHGEGKADIAGYEPADKQPWWCEDMERVVTRRRTRAPALLRAL